MNTQNAGRTVGALFLSAFLLYGGGSFLLDSTTDGAVAIPENAASLGQLSAGAALMLANSVAVATIGVLALRVLRRPHPRTGKIYVATRTVEAALLASAPLGILTLALLNSSDSYSGLQGLATTAVENSETLYWLAMTTLGVGSIFFCQALMKSALLPRPLALGGMVGYAIFALGGVLELSGYGVGLILSAPGGLFEVAAGGYLLVKGFKAAVPKVVGASPLAPRYAGSGLRS